MLCKVGVFLRSFCTDCFLLANMRNAQIIALDVMTVSILKLSVHKFATVIINSFTIRNNFIIKINVKNNSSGRLSTCYVL